MATGYDYEEYCCKYLKKQHFKNIEQTPLSGDHGVDIIARKGRKKYGFQCKYYSGKVGNHAIQQVYTGCSYYGCNIPVVITNSTFTKNAVAEAKVLGVQLWDHVDIVKKKHFFIRFLLIAALLTAAAYLIIPTETKSKLYQDFIIFYQNYHMNTILLIILLLLGILLAVLAIKKCHK